MRRVFMFRNINGYSREIKGRIGDFDFDVYMYILNTILS